MDDHDESLGIACLAAVLIVVSFWIFKGYLSKSAVPEFDGPRGIPFIGNELDIPQEKQWLKFDEWAKKYGDVYKLRIMGQDVLVLSSAEAAFDLLDAKGSIYSDRPRATMAGELVGWDRGLGYAPYGPRFRAFRKMFHQLMGPRSPSLKHFRTIQQRITLQFLSKLLATPTEFIHHARQSVGAAILMIAYGYETVSEDDEMVRIAQDAMVGFSKASEPGAFLVDRFPFLKYCPRWVPFMRTAASMREDLEKLYDVPFRYVESQLETGTAIPSFTSQYLTGKNSLTEEEKEFIKAAAASLYSGGADTSPSSISSLILALLLDPSVQARGQAEVDSVVGYDRLPTFEDRDSLPFINAIVKEIWRWNPAVPLGLPHQLTQDDVYRGRRIKKGTVVWANIWSILHNDKTFPSPMVFNPERYLVHPDPDKGRLDDHEDSESVDTLKSEFDDETEFHPKSRKAAGVDPSVVAFGFGRRICPGMHLADASLYITVASFLCVFDVSKSKSIQLTRDELGESEKEVEIEPEVDFVGFISHPKPFRCEIRPRSDKKAELVRNLMAQQSRTS